MQLFLDPASKTSDLFSLKFRKFSFIHDSVTVIESTPHSNQLMLFMAARWVNWEALSYPLHHRAARWSSECLLLLFQYVDDSTLSLHTCQYIRRYQYRRCCFVTLAYDLSDNRKVTLEPNNCKTMVLSQKKIPSKQNWMLEEELFSLQIKKDWNKMESDFR